MLYSMKSISSTLFLRQVCYCVVFLAYDNSSCVIVLNGTAKISSPYKRVIMSKLLDFGVNCENSTKRSNRCNHITLCNVNKCRSAMGDRHGYGVIVNKEACVQKFNRSDIIMCWLGGLINIS